MDHNPGPQKNKREWTIFKTNDMKTALVKIAVALATGYIAYKAFRFWWDSKKKNQDCEHEQIIHQEGVHIDMQEFSKGDLLNFIQREKNKQRQAEIESKRKIQEMYEAHECDQHDHVKQIEQKKKVYGHCIVNHRDAAVYGIIRFSEEKGGTRVQATIKGLPKGQHGFHIHEYGNLEEGCKSAGGHYNPYGKEHGGPKMLQERHVGDMGNIESDGKLAQLDYVDPLIKLVGPQRIIGRTVVVHQGQDDLGLGGQEDSKTTGHAGARLGCGVIGFSSPF